MSAVGFIMKINAFVTKELNLQRGENITGYNRSCAEFLFFFPDLFIRVSCWFIWSININWLRASF